MVNAPFEHDIVLLASFIEIENDLIVIDAFIGDAASFQFGEEQFLFDADA